MPFLFASLACRPSEGRWPGGDRGAATVPRGPGDHGRGHPGEYGRAIDIVTRSAIREMLLPALIPTRSRSSWGSQRAQARRPPDRTIVTGLFLAIAMTSGGGAWDNAKKLIEDGAFGGKGSEAHAASVTGGTVGDPYKDTAGPAINPMIKIANIVAISSFRSRLDSRLTAIASAGEHAGSAAVPPVRGGRRRRQQTLERVLGTPHCSPPPTATSARRSTTPSGSSPASRSG